jgi:hypothetical protein
MSVNYLMMNITQGIMGFQSFSFDAIKNIITTFNLPYYLLYITLLVIPGSCLTVISWICSESVYFVHSLFNLLDVFSVSTCFFACTFIYIGFCNSSLVYSDGKDGEYYYPFSLGGLNSSFIPATIVTSFIMLGMIFTYYHHN